MAIFKFSYKYDPEKMAPSAFQVLTEDHDLNLVWTIVRRSGGHQISLQTAEQNIFGMLISEDENRKTVKSTFDYTSLPFDQKLSSLSATRAFSTKITIYVYRLVETVNRIGDYNKFLVKKKENADVTFVVGEEEIPAYKDILASSSKVFTIMFGSDMLEKNTGRVIITDIKPQVFRLLLRYIESGVFESNDFEEVTSVMQAADKYSVKSLIDLCAYRLSNTVSLDNVCYLLMLSDMVKANFLKKDCLSLMVDQKFKLATTKCYLEMVKSRPDLISELFLHEQVKYLD